MMKCNIVFINIIKFEIIFKMLVINTLGYYDQFSPVPKISLQTVSMLYSILRKYLYTHTHTYITYMHYRLNINP